MADPDLQIRGVGGGGGGLKKRFFPPQFGLKIGGGGGRAPPLDPRRKNVEKNPNGSA